MYPSNTHKLIKVVQYILLIGGIIAGTILVKNFILPKAKAEAVIIKLTSVRTTYNRNQEYIASVFVDTRGQSISASQIELQWDSTFLDVTEITNVNYLPITLIPGTISGNKATLTLGAQVTASGAEPKNGTGILANIKFRTKALTGTTQITFTGNTQVAAIGSTVNVLGTTEALTVTITTPGSPTATPVSPTATPGVPTSTPSPTPTRSPSPTPTRSPSSAPSGVPTATGTPSGIKPGDVNRDGSVNIIDIGIIIDNYGRTTGFDLRADLNNDSIINVIDIGIVIDNYGR